MNITGEFPSVLMSHWMQFFGIPLRLEVSIKGVQKEGFFCANGDYWFFTGGGGGGGGVGLALPGVGLL